MKLPSKIKAAKTDDKKIAIAFWGRATTEAEMALRALLSNWDQGHYDSWCRTWLKFEGVTMIVHEFYAKKACRQLLALFGKRQFGAIRRLLELLEQEPERDRPEDPLRLTLLGAKVRKDALDIRELQDITGQGERQIRRAAKEMGFKIQSRRPGRPKKTRTIGRPKLRILS